MWSLGVTTYVLLTGFSPFGGETDQETFQNISLGEVDFPEELFEDVSAQAKDFVAKLLVLDPGARMTAKQCLRHEWLRGAPTQASPHLRRYLSKSREVLLERVMSRENLRRAALLSQTASQANLSCGGQDRNRMNQSLQDCLLSQSEMCLSHSLAESRSSLEGSSEGFPSPADSRTSLNSSRTSLSCASQSCLLNKEQTQGLLSRAQSRSQANLDSVLNHRGLLSRIRSLHRIQSQACLLNGTSLATSASPQTRMTVNPVIGKSREKLYGLRSLSKSQGVLDIYRSLECLRRRRKTYQERARTEDTLSIFTQLGPEVAASNESKLELDPSPANAEITLNGDRRSVEENEPRTLRNVAPSEHRVPMSPEEEKQPDPLGATKSQGSGSEENLDSLKSVESDTLTEDSDEAGIGLERKRPCERQHSDASSRSNNSGTSEEKEDRSTESETEEPKYTVAQLVSAFNKHQEVATKTSLKAIMTERRVNEVTFPTGTKALRLFIPDIDITESTIVRRKTSYKPRKNWEELRKRNEKNEGVLKSFDRDSGNEDADEDEEGKPRELEEADKEESAVHGSREKVDKQDEETFSADGWSVMEANDTNGGSMFLEGVDVHQDVDTTIDEKYKQCVRGKLGKAEASERSSKILEEKSTANAVRQKERLPNYIYPDVTFRAKDEIQDSGGRPMNDSQCNNGANSRGNEKSEKPDREKSKCNAECANVSLKDILKRVDRFQASPKENMEKLRKRTSITKILLNDNLPQESHEASETGRSNGRAKSEPPTRLGAKEVEERTKLIVPPSFVRSSSLSSDSSSPTPSSVQSDVNVSWEDVQGPATGSNASLEKEDSSRRKRTEVQRTSSEGRSKQCPEERKIWGRVCTGSYTRAMERFSGRSNEATKRTGLANGPQQDEKTRRKSSPTMPQFVNP